MSVFNASRLLGKTVLVTGASSGIGAATAVLFAKGGANVILLARRADALQKVQEECRVAHRASGLNQGGKFHSVQLDVSDKTQVASLLDKFPNDLRQVDILVNNAGYVLGVEHVGDIADADIEGMFATNVLGLISVTQLFVREFKKRQAGHVINLGSIAGIEPYAGGSIYTATKHAVHAFTASLMREVVNTPIRVTEIQPGMVETEFSVIRFRGDNSAAKKVYEGLEPLTAVDIAEEIVWAAARPPHVNIAELLVFPVNQASATINYRAPKKDSSL
ncbi:NAD(P)-binding protein [Pluteus cervinus]|uniref:NAD(P)-binding protein n=1 Tax=Pluteus cervinus TaxID=181527 RepID=A0ACD3BEH1_9AGAR|nr:NAD(P)-binding protein [Pluteus cervinus]